MRLGWLSKLFDVRGLSVIDLGEDCHSFGIGVGGFKAHREQRHGAEVYFSPCSRLIEIATVDDGLIRAYGEAKTGTVLHQFSW